jgi:GGDEF domain-containing protein
MAEFTSEQLSPLRAPIGATLLEKSHSIPPAFIATPLKDVESMEMGEIKNLYAKIVDERRKQGLDVGNEELMMSAFIQGEIEEPSYILQASTYITQFIENESKLFDSLSGLAFYTTEMRARVINAFSRMRAKGEVPSASFVVGDINRLKKMNIMYSKQQANRAIEVIGDVLRTVIEEELFSPDAEIFLGRMKQTGDEFIIIILGDDEAAKKITKRLKQRKWPTVPMRNQKTTRMDAVPVSLRIQEETIDNVLPDQDFGVLLNETIEKAEKEVDLTGHTRI